MNTDALFLFLILLLGLVFCSVLGGNCGAEGFDSGNSDGTSGTSSTSTNGASTSGAVNYDNYNHYSGSSTQLANGTTFYGKNGGYVVVSSNQDGSQGLRVVVAGGAKPISFSSQSQPAQSQPMQSQPMQSQPAQSQTGDNSSATFYGPNGASATVAMNANGQQSIQVQTASGSYDFSSGYGQPDSNAVATSSDSVTSTQYYGSTGSPVQLSGYSLAYQGTGGSANPSTMSSPSTMSAPSTAYDYSSSLPQGIPASQIPRGQEDMYILKSEIVPPVCPRMPCIVSMPSPREMPAVPRVCPLPRAII
jgi:hypothetical protein